MPLHLHHSLTFRHPTLSLPNLSLSGILPGISLPSFRLRSGKSSTSSSSGPSGPSGPSSSTSSSSTPPPPVPPVPYISHPSPISPSFPPHGTHAHSNTHARYGPRPSHRKPITSITVPGTAVPDDANFILEFRGRVGGKSNSRGKERSRSKVRGERNGQTEYDPWNGEGQTYCEEPSGWEGEGQGQTLGVRITDALNWTGLANPEEKVFGCCPHESIVLSCFWPAPGTFPSEPFDIPVRNERGESYTARMIAYVVAQEFREMLTTSPLSPSPDPTLPDFRLVRSSYTGPRRDPGIRLEDLFISRLWSRDGRVFWVEVRLGA
ncbi:uncharacterized protein STEHIDRAFT_165235 [Stereum hirsutum FP-91666 SS1]|uniref:uncharacterized protein n=1 Tax=Stereum hirsutum (strain FP-91666) TaxID=721885 RepID=UPI000440D9F9|nr:uncharacterized protein STEHIDRAFT_165235 [Stereum hirsutum FP-91666 SS1]EIM90707.1 hypothetical protein STEHIDRAFT_165235 [Stereum hirsutum FP-91666 SS1]